MPNILKDPKRLVTSSSRYGYRYLIKGKEVISSPQYGYRYLMKGKGLISSPQYGYRYLIKVKTGVIYLFYLIIPVSVTCYSIIMDVAPVIKAAE